MSVLDNRRDALEAFIANGSDPAMRALQSSDGVFYAIALTDGWKPDPNITVIDEAKWQNVTHETIDFLEAKPSFMGDTQVFYGRLLGRDSPHDIYPWPCKNFLVELIGTDSAPNEGELLQNIINVRCHTLFLWNNAHKPRIGDIFRVKLAPGGTKKFPWDPSTGQATDFFSTAGKSIMENWPESTTVQTNDYSGSCESLGDLFDYYDEAVEGDYPCIFRGPDSKYGKCIDGQGSREFEFPTVINPAQTVSRTMVVTQDIKDITALIFGKDAVTADNVAILLAIRAVESPGIGPSAFRFEPHKFLKYYPTGDIPYWPNKPDRVYPSTDGHEHGKRETRGAAAMTKGDSPGYIPGNGSHVRVTAFSRAYDQNRIAAIRATSWGTYQVLGEYLDRNTTKQMTKLDARIRNALNSDEDAQAFLDFFKADPQTVSNQMLQLWFNLSEKKEAASFAQKKEWLRFALLYNGNNCCKYTTLKYAKSTDAEKKTFNVLKVDDITKEEVTEQAGADLPDSTLVENLGGYSYAEALEKKYQSATAVATAAIPTPSTTG